MKRLFALLMILSIVFSMSGCKGTAENERSSEYVYSITKVNGDIDWNSIPTIPIDKVLWTEDYGIRAEGQICYDNENLYVHQRAHESVIRAENTDPLGHIYEDSCMEFFFMLEDSPNYFNFEINANGCLANQFGPKKTDRIYALRPDAEEYFDIHADRTDDGWEVYYRIPLEFIQLFYPDYTFKGKLAANMYKCGNKTVNKHYLSWTDIDLDEPNFHVPQFFGTLVFE